MIKRRRLIIVVVGLLVALGAVAVASLVLSSQYIEEERGKEIVAATAQVRSLAREHPDEQVRILALAQHRVHDRDLIAELYPEADQNAVTCVIVATAGDDGYVFLQGEEFRILQTETLDRFVARTNNVDPKLLARFYLSLR